MAMGRGAARRAFAIAAAALMLASAIPLAVAPAAQAAGAVTVQDKQYGTAVAGTASTILFPVTVSSMGANGTVSIGKATGEPAWLTVSKGEFTGDGTFALVLGTTAAATAGTTKVELRVASSSGTLPSVNINVIVSAAGSAAATLTGGAMTAQVGTGFTATATLQLSGTTVNSGLTGFPASTWFTSLPSGVSVSASATAGSSNMTLSFVGTPTAAGTWPFFMTVPSSALVGSSSGLTVSYAANQGQISVQQAVGTPRNVTAISGNGGITVSWLAPTGGGPVTGYEVSISLSGDSFKAVSNPGALQHVEPSTYLEQGRTYTVKIRAVGSFGPGAANSTTVLVYQSTSVPGKVTGLIAVTGQNDITVEWGPPRNSAGGVDSFLYYEWSVSPEGGPEGAWTRKNVDPSRMASTVYDYVPASNLTPGVKYVVKVRAVNSYGEGEVNQTTVVPKIHSSEARIRSFVGISLPTSVGSVGNTTLISGTGTRSDPYYYDIRCAYNVKTDAGWTGSIFDGDLITRDGNATAYLASSDFAPEGWAFLTLAERVEVYAVGVAEDGVNVRYYHFSVLRERPFEPVTSITLTFNLTATVDKRVELTAIVGPENAEHKDVSWVILDFNGAGEICEVKRQFGKDYFIPHAPGTVRMMAVVADGVSYGTEFQKTFNMTIVEAPPLERGGAQLPGGWALPVLGGIGVIYLGIAIASRYSRRRE